MSKKGSTPGGEIPRLPGPRDDRAIIEYTPGRLHWAADAAIAALARGGRVYAHLWGGGLVRIVEPGGMRRMQKLTHAGLRDELSRVARFRLDGKDQWPPAPIVAAVLARGEWPALVAIRDAFDPRAA